MPIFGVVCTIIFGKKYFILHIWERCGRYEKILSLFLAAVLVLGMFPLAGFLEAEGLENTSVTPDAGAEEINELFLARSEGQHPRMLADADDFARVRRLLLTDTYMQVWYERIYNYCVSQLDTSVSVYDGEDGDSILDAS